MREPSPRTSRLAIAGSLLALIGAGGGGFLLGRVTAPAPPTVTAASTEPTLQQPIEAPPERTLRRPDLIALGAAAADASASGAAISQDAAALAGRRFELDIPFGCDGPAPEGFDAPLRWRYDEEASALRLHVAPNVWDEADWWQEPPEAVEAMEGFWIEHPWTSRGTCPPAPMASAAAGTDPVTLPDRTLGVVQLISPDTPRQMRRDGKPYEAVIRMAADAVQFQRGLRVALKGRVGRFPDGQPARCALPDDYGQRPVCLIAVSVDEVAIRNPATGETLSVWLPTIDASGRVPGDQTD